MEQQILFSLILPAYNEEARLSECMRKVSGFVASCDFPIEVLIVVNGSQDRTFEIASEYADQYSWLRVYNEDQAGKGRAVRRGMLEAHGKYRMFADVDFSMPIDELKHFIPPCLENYQVAIASREAKGAVRYHEPAMRHFTGRIFNWVVRLIAVRKIHDTQCGFKSFSAETAQKLFTLQKIDGWAFDAEVLFIAQHLGYSIIEVPIQWYYDGNSKINVVSDSVKMLRELLQIRKNNRAGLYDQ